MHGVRGAMAEGTAVPAPGLRAMAGGAEFAGHVRVRGGHAPGVGVVRGQVRQEPSGESLGREQTGGRSVARARFTVFFEMPNFRAIARIGICSARCSLLISVLSSTEITLFS